MTTKTKTRAATKLDNLLVPKPSETVMIESLIKQIEATRSLVDIYRESKGESFDDDTDLGYAYDCLTRAAEILEDELLINPWPYELGR
jgi:hypothetical protein